jgi:hypothetical protein
METPTRSPWLAGLALIVFGGTGPAAQEPNAAALDCSKWMLDGYHLGMRGDELLAVRSVTLHVAGQAQVVEAGRLQGVLVLDTLNRLEKWDVRYDTADGEGLRAEMREWLGEPISDVTGMIDNESGAIRQRRTLWQSKDCDAAIIVYETTSVRGAPAHTVSATLARASILPPNLAEMKTLYH